MRFSKDQYVLRSFSKIKHKKWELFVITRIIHLLDDDEIEFVCQQLIRTKSHNRYLTDLCFLALKLYFEIDEAQHSSKDHKFNDQIRQKEIIDATDFVERRISVYDEKTKEDRSLEDIKQDILREIDFIRKRKEDFMSKGLFNAWNYEKKYSAETYTERGYIDVKDNVVFLNHREAMRCFGYEGGHYQRAIWTIKGTGKKVWFPKLYVNSPWNNELSDDFKRIIMRNKINPILKDPKEREKWIVFAHYKNLLGQVVYKFLGEFHLSVEESNSQKWVLNRKKSKVFFDRI